MHVTYTFNSCTFLHILVYSCIFYCIFLYIIVYSCILPVVPVWMAARATSAAPMYFISFNGYVDGGVKANNPSEFAMSRIRDYHDKTSTEQPHFSVAVSVGTGIIHNPKKRVSGNLNPTSLFTPKNLLDLLLNAVRERGGEDRGE